MHTLYAMSTDVREDWSRSEELEALLRTSEEHVIFSSEGPSAASTSTAGCCHRDRERCANPVDISLFLLLSLLPTSVSYARLLVARIALHVIVDAALWISFVGPTNASAKLALLVPSALLLSLGVLMLCTGLSECTFTRAPLQWWLFGLFKLSSLIVSFIFLAHVYIEGRIIFEVELLSAKLDACALLLLPFWFCRHHTSAGTSRTPIGTSPPNSSFP